MLLWKRIGTTNYKSSAESFHPLYSIAEAWQNFQKFCLTGRVVNIKLEPKIIGNLKTVNFISFKNTNIKLFGISLL
tara:strand:- start:778 stop:1005 length:228 start_codon:yes stop_codon:yes gene_type:complete